MHRQIAFVSLFFLRRVGTVLAFLLLPALANSQTIPSTLGWHEIPNTKIRPVCPDPAQYPEIQGNVGCEGVITNWSGGILDTTRNRLIIWGGGHNGYGGNELYALNLNNLTMQRLNDPSRNPPTTCTNSGIMPDGKPTAQHTYNHLAYIAHLDRMFVWGGGSTPCGSMQDKTWILNLENLAWELRNPSGPHPSINFGRAAVYDPNTQKVFLRDNLYFYSYTYETNTYERLSAEVAMIDRKHAIIDPKRKLYVLIMEGQMYMYDISPGSDYVLQPLQTTGTGPALDWDAYETAMAYDPVSDRIVAWDGGNMVYTLNMDTRVWTATSYAGGPQRDLQGTYGRWQYNPASGVFVLVNSVHENAYTLRLTPPDSDPSPPLAPITLQVQ